MNESLSPSQISEIVTALCALIVASSLSYLVKLLLSLKDEFAQMREKMAVHFAEDESLNERIARIESHLDRLVKLRSIRRLPDND